MPNKFFFILIFLLEFSGFCCSQSSLWYITRGFSGRGEEAWGVDTDSAGNIYWAVERKDQWPYWYYNITLYKIAPDSQQIWQSPSWGNGTGFNDIAFITKVDGQRVFLAGRTDSAAVPTSGDALVMCYDAGSGQLIWTANLTQGADYGYQEIDGVAVEQDGIYLTGWSQGDTTDVDFYIAKLDFSGNVVWQNTWDYAGLGKFDGANGHLAIDNNYIYAAGSVGRTNIGSLDGQMGLVCFNRADGSYQWDVTWGGSLYDDALGMDMSSDSMLYVVGFTGSYGNGSQLFLNKYTRNGQLLWSRIWGGSGTEDCRAVVADGDSLIFVAGATSSYGNGLKDVFVLKFDTSGFLLDSLFWGGAHNEVVHDFAKHGDFLYITGVTESFGNGPSDGFVHDALLLKVNGGTMEAPDTIMALAEKLSAGTGTVTVFPNPCNEQFTINAENILTDEFTVNIYDVYGNNIKTVHYFPKGPKSKIKVNTLGWLQGVYFTGITYNNVIITKKIIKL